MHVFIAGQSGSGKSYFAKKLVRDFKRAGIGTMVMDPLGQGNSEPWNADFLTANMTQFVELAARQTRCAIFVDECGQTVGLHPSKEVESLATISRHRSHCLFFIAQRGVMVNRTMRDQTDKLYLFNVNRKDAEEWALNYNDDGLRDAYKLEKRFYFEKHRFKKLIHGKPII